MQGFSCLAGELLLHHMLQYSLRPTRGELVVPIICDFFSLFNSYVIN